MSSAIRRGVLPLLLIGAISAPVAVGAATGPTGTLTVAYATLFDENLNPLLGPAPSKVFYDVMYEYLVYNDPQTLKAEPGLAERWSMSQDGKRWIFFLRKGVTFSDGAEFTAEDVSSRSSCSRGRSRAGPSARRSSASSRRCWTGTRLPSTRRKGASLTSISRRLGLRLGAVGRSPRRSSARSSLVLALCLFERGHDHLGIFAFYRVRHGTLAIEAALTDKPPQPGIVHRPVLDAPHAPPWLACLHDIPSPLACIVPNVERLRLLEHLPAPFNRPPIEGGPEMHMEEHTVVLRSTEYCTDLLFEPLCPK